MASTESSLLAHIRELQDDVTSTATHESITDTQLTMLLSSSEMDDCVRETFANMDSAIKTTAVSVKLNNLRHWNRLLSIMLELTGRLEKMEDRINHNVWWKQPGAWLTGFVLFLVTILFAFTLFKLDGNAAAGATGFVKDIGHDAADVTKSVTGGGGKSKGDNDYNYGDYGYGSGGNYGGYNSGGYKGRGE